MRAPNIVTSADGAMRLYHAVTVTQRFDMFLRILHDTPFDFGEMSRELKLAVERRVSLIAPWNDHVMPVNIVYTSTNLMVSQSARF